MCIMYKQEISILKSTRRNISNNNGYASGDVYTSYYTYYRKILITYYIHHVMCMSMNKELNESCIPIGIRLNDILRIRPNSLINYYMHHMMYMEGKTDY